MFLELARYLLWMGATQQNITPKTFRSNHMKKTILGLTLLLATATAQADLSANLGYMSEYHFRGILHGRRRRQPEHRLHRVLLHR